MKHAFISHSSTDKQLAEEICSSLEKRGINCWIAPRDIDPGKAYGEEIIHAIEQTSATILVLSENSNQSPAVRNEVERAFSYGKAVIPVRIRNVKPSKGLEFFVSTAQWIDAWESPMDAKMDQLAQAVKALSGVDTSIGITPPLNTKTNVPHLNKALLTGAVLVSLLIIGYLLIGHFNQGHSDFFPGTPRTNHQPATVTLTKPLQNSNFTGALLLSWSSENLDSSNLSFDVSLESFGKLPVLKRMGRNSFVPEDIEGAVKWKVRPIWLHPGEVEKLGPWSAEQTFTYYPNSLRRILATHKIVVGISEPDEVFIKKDGEHGGSLSGFEIDVLRLIFKQILLEHNISENLIIVDKQEKWGDEFFRLLDTDGTVDILASGISITPERRNKYGIDFTEPTTEHPQTLIIMKGSRGFANGKIVADRVAAFENTTNWNLASKLLGNAAEARLKPYNGTGAYDRMLDDLASGRVDAVLMDKTYALQKIVSRKKRDSQNGVELATQDIPTTIAVEKIGFAVRRIDQVLLREINEKLASTQQERRVLLEKYKPVLK